MSLSTVTSGFDPRSYRTDVVLAKIEVLKANPLFLELSNSVVKKALASQGFIPRMLGMRYDETAACSELKLSAIRLSVHIYDTACADDDLSSSDLKIYLVAATTFLNMRLARCSAARSMVLIKAVYETVLKKYVTHPLKDLAVENLSPFYLSSKTEELFPCFGTVLSKEKITESLLCAIAKIPRFVERVSSLVCDSTKTKDKKKTELASEMQERIVRLVSQRDHLLLKAQELHAKMLSTQALHDDLHRKILNRCCLLYDALRSLVHTRMDLGLLFLPFFESSEEYDEFFSSETSIRRMVRSNQFSLFVHRLETQRSLGVLTLTLQGGVKVKLRDFLHTLSTQKSAFFIVQEAYLSLKTELSSIAGSRSLECASSTALLFATKDSQIGRLNTELGDFATGEITVAMLLNAAEERLVFLEGILPQLISMATSS